MRVCLSLKIVLDTKWNMYLLISIYLSFAFLWNLNRQWEDSTTCHPPEMQSQPEVPRGRNPMDALQFMYEYFISAGCLKFLISNFFGGYKYHKHLFVDIYIYFYILFIFFGTAYQFIYINVSSDFGCPYQQGHILCKHSRDRLCPKIWSVCGTFRLSFSILIKRFAG